MTEYKACSKCKVVRSITEFRLRPSRGNQPDSWCKYCYRAAAKSWKVRHPERKKSYDKQRYFDKKVEKCAHRCVAIAIKKGSLPKPTTCNRCGREAADDNTIQYHHHSYEQQYWLDVEPLCASCHKKEHLASPQE